MNEILIHGRHLAGPILLALDLLGTFVFALSGAAAGVKSKLDLFGLMVLAFAAGNAGGITRDLLIGAVPPAAISNWHYLAVSLLAGLATFFWYPDIDKWSRPVLLCDAAGLALFAVTGTQKALAVGLNPVMAALMGMLTGIGVRGRDHGSPFVLLAPSYGHLSRLASAACADSRTTGMKSATSRGSSEAASARLLQGSASVRAARFRLGSARPFQCSEN